MRFRYANGSATTVPGRIAILQFSLKVFPFVTQLALGLGDRAAKPALANLRGIKTVPSPCCLLEHDNKVSGHSGHGHGVVEKTTQLWVMLVTLRPALQDRLREQPFPPESHQALYVKVPWMDRPESHSNLNQGSSSIVMSR